MSTKRERIVESLRDRQYRHLYAAEHSSTGIAVQIRAMRESRGWTQTELGERAGGMNQVRISKLEDLDYGRFSLKTLQRLALAFDVALIVTFAPFSKLVDWITGMSEEDLAVPSFENDRLLEEHTFEGLPSSSTRSGFAVGYIGQGGAAAEAIGRPSNLIDFEACKQGRTLMPDRIYAEAKTQGG